jgi:hypothetical protein
MTKLYELFENVSAKVDLFDLTKLSHNLKAAGSNPAPATN